MTKLETRTEDGDEKPNKTTKKKSSKAKATPKKASAKEKLTDAERLDEDAILRQEPVEEAFPGGWNEPVEPETKATESPRGDHDTDHLPGPGPANRRRK